MMNKTRVDAMYEQLIEKFVKWAEGREDIRSAIIVGSRARVDYPADEWADLDLLIVTSNPDQYIAKDDWIENMGSPLLTFIEPTSSGEDLERRVLYEGMIDVDFAIIPTEKAKLLRSGADLPPQIKTNLANTFGRGARVIIDKDGLAATLNEVLSSLGPLVPQKPSEAEFRQVVNDFLYHTIFAFKHLRRGELWWAKMTTDCYMQQLLLHMIEWHARAIRGWTHDTWFRGRFLERWADPRVLKEMSHVFARYEEDDMDQALLASLDLFRWLATETAEKLAYDYPSKMHERLSAWMRTT